MYHLSQLQYIHSLPSIEINLSSLRFIRAIFYDFSVPMNYQILRDEVLVYLGWYYYSVRWPCASSRTRWKIKNLPVSKKKHQSWKERQRSHDIWTSLPCQLLESGFRIAIFLNQNIWRCEKVTHYINNSPLICKQLTSTSDLGLPINQVTVALLV